MSVFFIVSSADTSVTAAYDVWLAVLTTVVVLFWKKSLSLNFYDL